MPGKKKTIRDMRNTSRKNPDDSRSSHVMEWGSNPDPKKKRLKYEVNPTIFPNKDGSWTDKKGQGMSAYKEAKKRGEVVEFSSKKRAAKIAAGAWKKGKDKKEAMKSYRKSKSLKKALNKD
jgi:hypothetical protein